MSAWQCLCEYVCVLCNYFVLKTTKEERAQQQQQQQLTQETSFGELWATAVVNQLKVTNTLNICFRILSMCVSENCYFSLVVPCARCGPTCVNWIGNFRICTNFSLLEMAYSISWTESRSLSVCVLCAYTHFNSFTNNLKMKWEKESTVRHN